LSLKNLLK